MLDDNKVLRLSQQGALHYHTMEFSIDSRFAMLADEQGHALYIIKARTGDQIIAIELGIVQGPWLP